jgi:5-methyltetrahydropteroyltriglutamate--homocysteine methyltransferase
MNRSTDRILTTHTGSLPRPPDLIELLRQREQGELQDKAALDARVQSAVVEIVQKQLDSGIDIVSDGEAGKPGYSTYIRNRVSGFGGSRSTGFRQTGEAADFPEFAVRRAATQTTLVQRPACDGPIAWQDFAAVEQDIANLAAAAKATGAERVFMTAASPGVISFFLANEYYPTDDAYLEALCGIMKDEYEAVAKAGFDLQLDCPDLAMSRHSQFADLPTGDFRKVVQRHVEVVNEATKNIPPEQMRIHLCWGNYEGPHHLDIPLKDIIDIVLTARPAVVSFEGANPRHEHEWVVWHDVKLPDGKIIMPGVIDSTTNFIEHPELVAQRLVRYAEAVGKENVIAGTDCGFGTNAASTTVDARVAWAKLKAMSEGAALASKQLW